MNARRAHGLGRCFGVMLTLAVVAPAVGYPAAAPATAPHAKSIAKPVVRPVVKPVVTPVAKATPKPIGTPIAMPYTRAKSRPSPPAAVAMAGSVMGRRASAPTTLGGPSRYDPRTSAAIGGTLMRPKPR